MCSGTLGVVFESVFSNLADTWTDNAIMLTSNGALPAKDRGYYYNGSSHMTFDTDFRLNIHFTISSWINTTIGANMTIFSKDDNATDPLPRFVFTIKSDGKLLVKITKPADTATTNNTESTASIGSDTWVFVAGGLKLNPDAVTATVNFKIDNAADVTITTSSGTYFVDDVTTYKAYLGAERTSDQTSFGEYYTGFMYTMYIENTYASGSPRAQFFNGSCTTASCLIGADDGVQNYPFT